MPTLISTATATTPIGNGHQGHLFKLPDGPYAGRLFALFARTPSVIAWSRADAPYTDWITPIDAITDASDDPFAAVMDVDGNVYVAYTAAADGALKHVKLVNIGGTWAKDNTVTVYGSATSANRYPSILKDTDDDLRVTWTRIDNGVYSLRSKTSLNDGDTFGGGDTDPGLELDTGSSSLYAQLVQRSEFIHCLYACDGATLRHRRIELGSALWDSAETLYTGTIHPHDFHAALAADNVLGIVFATDAHVYLKEFDGAVWGALQTVAASSLASPILAYIDATPFAQMIETIGINQSRIVVAHRQGNSFTSPDAVSASPDAFDSVFCVNADADSPFADRTTFAADTTPGDVFHPESGALIGDVGDILYLGLDNRFAVAHIELATPGTGGDVTWEYWDGATWNGFVPESGSAAFDASSTVLRFFDDTQAIPLDWKKSIVNGVYRFWIRATVTTAYNVAPVGTQITAAANISQMTPALTP